MVANLGLGSLLVSMTVLIHSFGLIMVSRYMPAITQALRLHRHGIGKAIAMVAVVLGVFFIHTIEIWLWAAMFILTGALSGLEDALFYSTAAFATTGSADMAVKPAWRLLASFEGVNGFILIGWSTAYLVSASTRFGPFRRGEHF
jgi:hypothetical protein